MILHLRRFLAGSLLSGLAFLSVGCATGGAVKNVGLEVARVQEQIRILAREVAVLDSLTRAQGMESRRMSAELGTDSEDVKQRVRQVQAKLDEATRRLSDMSKDVESARLFGGGRPALSARSAASPPLDAAGLPGAGGGVISDVQSLYNQASEDMKSGQYSLAILEFSQLLESSPQSELSDNALYWLGESYLALKDHARAVDSLQRLLAEYPQSEMIPTGLLKLGTLLIENRERDKGSQKLKTLIKSFPETEEAKQAVERLKRLGSPSRPGAVPRR